MERQRVRQFASWALVVLFILAAAVAAERRSDDVQSSLAVMGPGPIALSALLALLGVQATAMVWLCLARGAGLVAPASAALSMYNASQLGKYVPGSIWPVIAQMEFGRRSGTPRRVLLAAYTLVVFVLGATGLIVGVSLLALSGTSTTAARYSWLILLLPLLIVGMHPRAVPNLMNRVLALSGRDLPDLMVRPNAIGKAIVWSLVAWLLLGLHLTVLIVSLGESGGNVMAISIGAMALAWAAGLLVVFAPAGIGVRDSILVASFTGLVGGSGALAIAVASRVLLLLADLILAGLGGLLTVWSRRRI